MARRFFRGFSLFGPLAGSLAALLVASPARASNITEVGEGGSEQMQRGGAWLARATDPNAAYYNPAGLAGQDTRVSLSVNLITQHTCFTRVLAANDTTQEPLQLSNPDGTPNGLFPRVCNDIAPFPNPQIAFNYRVSDRVGVALAVLGPNAAGQSTWPEFYPGTTSPSPQRYLLLKSSGLQLMPTLGVGWEVVDGLRLGASFTALVSRFKLTNASAALNTEFAAPASNDVKALVQVKDLFEPGFTLGALYSPIDELDIAGWYKWSAPIDAKGDLISDAPYFTKTVAQGDTSHTKGTDTSYADCGYGATGHTGCGQDAAELKVNVPMEAKLGFRYHKPRDGGVRTSHRRDPLSQDVFDIELDVTWANNSALDAIQIRFPGDASGNGTIPINGIAGGTLPPVADVKTGYKDVFGARLGGDWNVIPDELALRAGVFGETNGQDPQYQNIEFAGAARLGLAFGGTLRLHLGHAEAAPETALTSAQVEGGGEPPPGASAAEPSGPTATPPAAPSSPAGAPAIAVNGAAAKPSKGPALELTVGYGHIFFAVQDQGAQDRYAAGLPGLAGVACNPANNAVAGNACSDGRPKYRTNWPVNLGTIWNSVNTINVGVAYRF